LEINEYKAIFIEHLNKRVRKKEPVNLYNPITYILNLGGKRLRPILTLLSCDLFGGDKMNALDAALAIEMFHNFSLVHDDIMDRAPLRRGKRTVHEKWDLNTAILSGDAMLVLSSQLFETYSGDQFKNLISIFNQTSLEVCEGQQYDIDFESRINISIEEYIKMITLKTAVLVAASLKIGAIIASAVKGDLDNIYDYGINLGVAFQLQDDYLDVFGNDDFGKRKAGDIVENKKTFLYLKTREIATDKDRVELVKLYETEDSSETKIKKVIELFRKYQIPTLMEEEIQKYTFRAQNNIQKLSLNDNKKKVFITFADQLMQRTI